MGRDLCHRDHIYRDEGALTTISNGGSYTDNIGQKGGGGMTYTYKACDAGTTTCSNSATTGF